MSPDEYWPALEPVVSVLQDIPHRAWQDFVTWIPEADRAAMFEIPRAGFLQWRMIVQAEDAFGTNGPVRMAADDDGLHFLVIENGQNPIGVEFGKGGENLRRHKNSNPKNRTMLGQMCFSFFEDAPYRFNLVYTLSGIGLSLHISRIALTVENASGLEWRRVLYDIDDQQGSGDGFNLSPENGPSAGPSEGPPPPQILPKSPATDGEEVAQEQKNAG